jgi:hypothetical protein
MIAELRNCGTAEFDGAAAFRTQIFNPQFGNSAIN